MGQPLVKTEASLTLINIQRFSQYDQQNTVKTSSLWETACMFKPKASPATEVDSLLKNCCRIGSAATQTHKLQKNSYGVYLLSQNIE